MVKIGLWLAAPSTITFLASSDVVRLENTLFVLALSVVALAIGIGPRLTGKNSH
ncbi:MAG TPA: hypothetical protein VGA88_07820 [Burkholderiales bacterium]